MGNFESVPAEIIKENVKKNESHINENPINEEEIFNKIWKISNDLLIEYNSEFLKEDFCNKIAIIYKKNYQILI